MKKVIIILAFVSAAFAVQAQTKVGHINSSELIEKMPEADTIQLKLQKEQSDWQAILEDKKAEANKKYNALMAIAEDPTVSQSVKEIKAKEVENLQVQYQELNQRANEALQLKQEELLTPLLDKIKKTIEVVAKEKGYDYVMDTSEGSGVIYFNASHDLMPAVKAKLGIKN
ncbi:MAG: hypothetical protein RLZZ337_259 [Bacteroidota bacterium]|jgi:outer membrane protein